MFKGLITAGSYTSGNVPMTQYKNTNNNFSLKDNLVSLKKDGVVNVKANIIVTPSAEGTVTAQLYGNGAAIPGAYCSIKMAASDVQTLTINDAVVVANQASSGYATLGIQISAGCTLSGGDIICEYLQ